LFPKKKPAVDAVCAKEVESGGLQEREAGTKKGGFDKNKGRGKEGGT